MSEKIMPQHLARKAILYVRQSAWQVANNLESQRLQYAMEAHLRQMGWQNIEIIDEDFGRSAAGGVTRSGFERYGCRSLSGQGGRGMCSGSVAVRAQQHRLATTRGGVQDCRYFADRPGDGVRTSRQSNDRLLLGLKGTLNEYEIDLLCHRASEARVQKAKREKWFHIPGRIHQRMQPGAGEGSSTCASRMRSHSCSASSWNWETFVRLRYGSLSTGFRSPPKHCGEKFTGGAHHTRGFIVY